MTLVKKKRVINPTGRITKKRPSFGDVWGLEEPVEPLKKKVIKEEPIKEKLAELDRNDLKNWSTIYVDDLRMSDFPLCCGMRIINNFPNQGGFTGFLKSIRGLLKNNPVTEYNDVPKVVVQKYVEKQLEALMNNVSQGMVIVLNSLQTPLFEEVVLNCGFKKVVEPFLYTGHGRDLTMYFCHPTRGKTLSKSTF